jgi:hypothetical protein
MAAPLKSVASTAGFGLADWSYLWNELPSTIIQN